MTRHLAASRSAMFVFCAAIALTGGLSAISARANDAHHPSSVAQAISPTGTGEGEVRKIDKATKKVTLRHGPIQELDMEAMTMVFQVADPAMLDRIAVGNKVKFTVRQGGGALTLLSIEPLK